MASKIAVEVVMGAKYRWELHLWRILTSFWAAKKNIVYFQTNMQATVDDECRFTSFELGWPGCVTDMTTQILTSLATLAPVLQERNWGSQCTNSATHATIQPPPVKKWVTMPMYKVIEALLILHNICIDFSDALESIFDFAPKDNFPLQDLTTVNLGYIAVDGDAAIPPYKTDQWIREAGCHKRKLIFNDLFPPL
ncbi:hypothetical protein C8J55DRAFT_493598 [Lentinula edodes]|uniref:Uncharacterized protein n=1 Tax=Lentinula lateritia TaxID=40482 RepID=A0A9W8ZS08_9AGAR|nr:hypothetical protein C8J55DRAFT_493598 [Lentinula edodes]